MLTPFDSLSRLSHRGLGAVDSISASNLDSISASSTVPTPNLLLQVDLIYCILDHLLPDWPLKRSKEAYQTLFILAQTCRALSEPSLDYLRSKLESLKPLIRCISHVWNENKKNMPLSSAEWAIIRRYTHRIKELKVYLVDQESHWFLRVTGVQACPLFPNLRVLSWPARGAGFSASRSIELLQRLLSPSLVSVDLVLTDMNDVMAQSFISGLYRRCPDLESVVIYHSNITGWKVSQTTIRSLSQTTSFLRYLECLCVDVPIDGVALTHIATSPKVKELKLVLHPDKSCLRQFRLPSDTIPFCNVRDLSLRIWDLDFLTTFLHTKDQAFRSFRLNLCSRPTIQALAVFLDVLASPQRTHSLQSLTLSLSLKESDEPQNITAHAHLPCDTLRPLARLSHLRELNINLNHCLFIDDHDLTSLARHWPLIQDLHLIGCSSPQDHISPPRTHITLYGLVSLVECCRHIRCLYLTVDATEVPLNTPPWIVRNPKLTHIWFIDSPIGLSEPVARFLHQHLPLLRGVFSSFHKPSVYGDAASRYEKAWSCAKSAIERSWYVNFFGGRRYV